MKRVGVFHATREGQSEKVARRIAGALVSRGLEVAEHEVRDAEASLALSKSEAVVLVGSVHLGKHEPELIAFVKKHRARLEAMPTAFLSVCGAEAGFEHGPTPELRSKAAAHVAEQLRTFFETTHWHPRHVMPVAGAFVYTHYNPLVRWVMKQIAKSEGLSTDTSRDHEYTDWAGVDDFAERLAEELSAPEEAARV